MLASCQKEEFIETPSTAGVTEFTATIEQPTKTAIASDGKVTWTAGDEITVTDAASKSAVYVAASSGSSTKFNLKDGQTAVESGPYTATYGDITKQKYSAVGANCPLTAKTADASTKNLQFISPYAVLKSTAKSSGSEVIKKVVASYGNSSSVLDCGEGVTLTSTAFMFQGMTKATSISGAEYLDVANVTNMSYMFLKYGFASTVLNVVPDVSSWNTGNVTSMANMFNRYGYSSTALTKVPDVSSWNTAYLTNLGNMFQDYGGLNTGGTSTVKSNVDFTLDLSGWDLTKLGEDKGNSVFDFVPNTFTVKIPSKTGEKDNETGKWYYGPDGTKGSVTPAYKSKGDHPEYWEFILP